MSALKLAASNIGWTAEEDPKVMELMAELGFSGLEVAPTRVIPDDPYSHNDQFAAYVAEVRETYGLEVCSMQSIWRGRTESIFDDEGSRRLLDYTERALGFAQAGSVHNLVFGCPGNRNVPDGKKPQDAFSFLAQCGQAAKERGTVFAIEANPPIYGTNFLNATADAIEFLAEMPSTDGLSINLDVGTLIAMNEGADVVRRAMPVVSHVHISEPGLAPIVPRELHRELKAVLEDVDYAGYVSLEMSTHDYQSVRACLEYVSDTFLG